MSGFFVFWSLLRAAQNAVRGGGIARVEWALRSPESLLLLSAILAAMSVTPRIAEASHCGSYVIAHPLGLGTGTHHIPTPCEKGLCGGPTQLPITPPPAPPIRPLDQLHFQLSSALPNDAESQSLLIVGTIQSHPGFTRQLERPPEVMGA